MRSSPAGGSVAMYTMFLLAMASARRSIYITNPYFVPDDKMIETLVQARRRGVRVVLLLPGAIDHNLVRQASRASSAGCSWQASRSTSTGRRCCIPRPW